MAEKERFAPTVAVAAMVWDCVVALSMLAAVVVMKVVVVLDESGRSVGRPDLIRSKIRCYYGSPSPHMWAVA